MDFKSEFQNTETESGFSLIESGEYEAELTNCTLDTTKEPNRFTIEVTITSEPYAGRKGWLNYNLEGRGIGFLKKDLTTLGLDHTTIDSPESIVDLVGACLNASIVVFVNQKPYNGKTYNNFYLNALTDIPAALDNKPAATVKPSPTNAKEAERQAAMKDKKAGNTTTTKPMAAKGKPAAKKPPVTSGAEPNFEESDEVPW